MAFYNSISDKSNFVISFSSNPKQDFGAFAKGYSQAADILAQNLLAQKRFSDYEAYPVVFLYRQAFELYLKGFYFRAGQICAFRDTEAIETDVYKHRLAPLAQTFKKICQILFPSDKLLLEIADKIDRYASEFEQIDFNSLSYRYPINTKGKASTKRHQVVNLLALHQAMQELLSKLEIIDFGFDIEASQAQEIYEVIQEAHSIIASEKGEAG